MGEPNEKKRHRHVGRRGRAHIKRARPTGMDVSTSRVKDSAAHPRLQLFVVLYAILVCTYIMADDRDVRDRSTVVDIRHKSYIPLNDFPLVCVGICVGRQCQSSLTHHTDRGTTWKH